MAPGFGDRREGHARGHRDPHRRQGRHRRTSASSSENVRVEDLGKAKKVTIDKDNTTIVEGGGEGPKIEGRVKQIARRSRRPPRTMTARNSRSAWRSSWAASR